MLEIKKVKNLDQIKVSDLAPKISTPDETELLENNVHLYVVDKSTGEYRVRKKHNVVVNQGKNIMLQRLTGIPSDKDYTSLKLRYFAAGNGAGGGSRGFPVPEAETDTDLISKVAPKNSAPNKIGTYYLDVTTSIYYDDFNRLRFSIHFDDTHYSDGTILNEFGLYAGDPSKNLYKLFARFTNIDITITSRNLYIIDWFVVLPSNLI